MLIDFFYTLKQAQVPVSIREFLDLLGGLKARVVMGSVDDFYQLARCCLVKDERHYDRFDQAFSYYFRGISNDQLDKEIPEDWLRKQIEKFLSEEEKKKMESIGWDELMQRLKQRLEEQKERHQGGNKWIGTGGTSPFGAYGFNPEGVRIGQDESRHRRAVKVWDKREFKNLDDSVELGTRNMKVALRKLRRFARSGSSEILDLDSTIKATANNAGWLDIKMTPKRHNNVKVLLFFDIGGSMDDHIRTCEALFSACRTEFRHLEYFYFHNCVYESVWKDNSRRNDDKISTEDLLHTYGEDYRLIFVGDATMSPYEISYPGGSVEHWNEQPGEVWMKRLLANWPKAVWLNPQPVEQWQWHHSISQLQQIMEKKMFPLTLGGLDNAMRELNR
ncbi:vWA domain-containing protein [Pelagibaculum spongiae]|uniref:VWA domain-containing protein n=1 Tax=Pelagibaculum spongiae TaxID=2080658 RepID=A0A2V1GPK6_9GAMM|nr:VWA domain-containing protein [Pelagibaculum spongiae]PVZ64956.1 VWA domain-containing protein [Pelagibaculum spongiae]